MAAADYWMQRWLRSASLPSRAVRRQELARPSKRRLCCNAWETRGRCTRFVTGLVCARARAFVRSALALFSSPSPEAVQRERSGRRRRTRRIGANSTLRGECEWARERDRLLSGAPRLATSSSIVEARGLVDKQGKKKTKIRPCFEKVNGEISQISAFRRAQVVRAELSTHTAYPRFFLLSSLMEEKTKVSRCETSGFLTCSVLEVQISVQNRRHLSVLEKKS